MLLILGNFTQEARLLRQDYHERISKMVEMLREVMRRADRTLWRCDPDKHQLGSTYEEVTRLLQGYIENEVEMSKSHECWNTCNDYATEINSDGCFKDKFCSKQERCTGKIYNCTFIDSDMDVCQSVSSRYTRYFSYSYISYLFLYDFRHAKARAVINLLDTKKWEILVKIIIAIVKQRK